MSIPFHAGKAFPGECTYFEHLGECECPPIDAACAATEVVEISVNQNDEGKQVLGTLCPDHAAIWSGNHIEIKE